MSSYVPEPVAMSTAEAECNALTITIMKLLHIKFIICELVFGDLCISFTVPILTDSRSAMQIAASSKETRNSKHIERRLLYVKYAALSARVNLYHVSNELQLADAGTKNLTSVESAFKLSLMEANTPDTLRIEYNKLHDYEPEEG
jgi:hypothetical protein